MNFFLSQNDQAYRFSPDCNGNLFFACAVQKTGFRRWNE